MKSEVVEKWVSALRGGKFNQAKHVLNRIEENDGTVLESFCCMGVLCKLYEEENGSLDHEIDLVSTVGKKSCVARKYDGQSHVLPSAVLRWAGMNDCLGDLSEVPKDLLDPIKNKYVSEARFNNSLVDFNDRGATFEELADVIEMTKEYL